ncbi:MAG TPA: hypothetical protein VNN24_04020 [Candidatus Binatus sp.]|nr:hypothetical protein [Candidatus Binatus sp.]
MRRILLLVIAGAAAAVAIWYAWRISQKTSGAPISVFLPRETIFLAHLPDFNRTRDQWHHSDLYLLSREPAVQDFLRKPLSKLPKKDAASQTLRDFEQLGPRDAFFALTSIDNNNPKFAGGFRFQGSPEDAERVIGKWRSNFLEKNPAAKREKLQYEHHEIEMVTATPFALATAYDRPWFFAATDLAELKAILDRADGRLKNSKVALDADEAYRAAAAHMPSSYAASFYLQPKTLSERIAALRAAIQSPVSPNERTMLQQVRGISGATSFENGKIHDLLFLEMPELEEHAKITRSSLTLGTKDTVFYLSMLLNVGQKFEALSQAAAIGGAMQKLFQTFSNSGITADDWKAAFGLELGSLADWPSSAHWPSLLLTLPVIDATKAGEIVDAIISGGEDAIWTQTEKDGVRYFSMQSPASLIAVTPTIGLSNRTLIAGFNPVSVEEAIKRGGSASSELSNSQTYKNAARSVPSPSNFFAYVDTALLYSRLDASLRPMFLLASALMPGITDYVNLGKLPAAEVITKHLSPIVSSQRYDRDGYVAESVGPLTLDQSAIGLAILGSVGAAAHQKAGTSLTGWGSPTTGTSHPSLKPLPTAKPAPTP